MIDLSEIAPDFSFLEQKGLTPIAGTANPQNFGNADLVMIGAPFSLRFQRDRGQIFVDVGSTANGWHKLEYVLEFVEDPIKQQNLGDPPDLSAMAVLLQSHWDEVASLFRDRRRMARFHLFAKQKSTALLSRIFGKH